MAKATAIKVASTAALDRAEEWTGDSLSDGGLEDLLGFHLRMANVAIYRDFAATIGEYDLTQKQTAILSLVGANPGVSQVAIGARLGADRATIMAMVDRLEARGFIRRERSKSDRRRQELFLTPIGKKTLIDVRGRIAEHEKHFTSIFTKAELRGLFEALKRIQGVVPPDES